MFSLSNQAAVLTLVLSLPGTSAHANSIIGFDELPSRPVDGLVWSGVEFSFQLNGSASNDATFGYIDARLAAIDTPFLSGSVLEGNAQGILTFYFATPVSQLSFGAILNNFGNYDQGYSVALFDERSLPLAWLPISTSGAPTGAAFDYRSDTPIKKAVVDFDENASNGRFALDNLSVTPVPVPAGVWLLGSALFTLLGLNRQRRLAKY